MLSVRVSTHRTGPLQPARHRRHHDVLGIAVDAGAEAAADVGGDVTDPSRLDVEGAGDLVAVPVRMLARAPHGDAAVIAPHRGGGPDLEGTRGHALVDDALAHHHLAVGEEVLVGAERQLEGGVGPRLGEEQHLVAGRGLGIDHGGQRLVVDEDQLGRVGSLVGVLGHDRDHRLADEAHHLGGQHRLGHGPVAHGHLGGDVGQGEILTSEHRDDPGGLSGRLDVDGGDAGVGDGRPHEGQVDGARDGDVGGVLTSRRQELSVFGAADSAPQDAHRGRTLGELGTERRLATVQPA
jgi:hypothetical protein